MRDLANEQKIFEFFKFLGRRVRGNTRVYLTGGSTAVLIGWRDSTLDIDLRFEPELDEVFRALPELKEQLQILSHRPISSRHFPDGRKGVVS